MLTIGLRFWPRTKSGTKNRCVKLRPTYLKLFRSRKKKPETSTRSTVRSRAWNMGLRRGFAKNGQILQRREFCAREYWLGRCVANVCKDAHSRHFRREVLADWFFV